MKLHTTFEILLFAVCVATVQPLRAFPTQAEIKTATDVVGDLVADDVRAANAGKQKREDVACKLMGLVDQAETDAAKWVLMKHAFMQYAKAGNYAKAGEVLSDMLAAFPDAPPQTVITLIEKNCVKANAKNAPALTKIRKLMYMRQKCSGVVADAKASTKAKAEAHCLLGDWEKGLKLFAAVGGKSAEMAAAEKSGSQPKHVVANYWWDYKSDLDTCDQFKAHAAEIYKAALTDGSLAGLYKNVAEKRIAEVEAVPTAEATPKAAAKDDLTELKKICNTKGLVHCWRFNGNLKDCVGGGEAKLSGEAKLGDGCVSYPVSHSNIDLGGKMLPEEDNVTIELWVKPNSMGNSQRMFMFGRDKDHRIAAIWNWRGTDEIGAICGTVKMLRPAFSPFEMGLEYHLALVIEREGKNYKATAYRQDVKTGKTLSKRSMVIDNGWSPRAFEHKDSWLGASYWGDTCADASYNEFRIWNRALSEKELTQNAIKFHKAGEMMQK